MQILIYDVMKVYSLVQYFFFLLQYPITMTNIMMTNMTIMTTATPSKDFRTVAIIAYNIVTLTASQP